MFHALILFCLAWPLDSAPPAIKFPNLPVASIPQTSDAVPVLEFEQLYVVESDAEFFLLASPKGLVRITYDDGPMKIRAKFADGSAELETRTYESRYIATVEASKGASGRVELIAIPAGVQDEGSIARRLIDIGVGPQPPPDPEPKPPGPSPAPAGFRVLMVYESSAKLTQEQRNILNSTAITGYLNAHCVKHPKLGTPEWRKWDKDIEVSPKESETMRKLWEETKPKLGELPQILIVVNGKGQLYPLPETEAETLKLLKQNGGE